MFSEININAYLDDYNLIVVETQEELFSCALKLEGKLKFFNAIKFGYEGGKYKYHVEHDLELDLSKLYQLHINGKYTVNLVKRKIVQTKRFDDEFYFSEWLGYRYTKAQTTFRIWAPIAEKIILVIESGKEKVKQSCLLNYNSGIYETTLKGDYELAEYYFLVTVNEQIVKVTDPYAVSSTINSQKSIVVDFEKLKFEQNYVKHDLDKMVIYETSVCDFTSDENREFKYKGKYLGMIEEGFKTSKGYPIGIDHLTYLGISHIQLMPIFDFGSVDEEVTSETNYNWGYDPVQYNVPEGSYLVNHDGYSRIKEPQMMIAGLKARNIGIIMDVVYNHVYNPNTFSMSQITPFYCVRYDENNNLLDGTGCGNELRTEAKMMRKFILDSFEYWTKVYKIDGFRIDLMGIMDIETVNQVAKNVKAINPNAIIYGEGWNMECGLSSDQRATQLNANKLKDIGFFNDDFRDYVRGPNNNLAFRGHVQGIGNEKLYERLMRGQGTDEAKSYTSSDQVVNYLSCHDDHTLYDRLKMANFDGSAVIQEIKESYKHLFQAKGIKFIHSGCEFGRTKFGRKNTYNDLRSINKLDWHLASKNRELVDVVKGLIESM